MSVWARTLRASAGGAALHDQIRLALLHHLVALVHHLAINGDDAAIGLVALALMPQTLRLVVRLLTTNQAYRPPRSPMP